MNNQENKISIVIIGYNTESYLSETLRAIDELQVHQEYIEVIYIDDGSTDRSCDIFNTTTLKYKKKMFTLKENSGRVAARSKGVELAQYDWILFLNSNIVVNKDLIIEYTKSISSCDALVYMGSLKYQSKDTTFCNYLNHPGRGINNYKNNSLVDYKNVLFSNCLVRRSVFDSINFNVNLRFYGGEELDWAYTMNQQFPNKIRASKYAIALRNNHPDFIDHTNKLLEFGKFNFIQLNETLQLDIVKYKVLLRSNRLFLSIFKIMLTLSFKLYKIPLINVMIIRLGFLSAILNGYYKSKLSSDFKIT
ncbi:MAG: hypothetical protein CMG05_02370 [Candidatus Marinimicrobia bacterium]|nr:hypothetical protein [Candidatus Neomarinimicrobiota bacterium]|tara:strand:+ start:596 stop:1513 length:918 start_codon:yes stop_codon:yes gene_type:complete